jgi:formylglycine-generating enzyme required for sulfatase activity
MNIVVPRGDGMAEIFISYKSERRKAAEHLAAVLSYYGYSVWFDYQLIKGSDFGLQIDHRVREAKALVVLWCSLSVGSRWVVEEVDLAHNLGILIPVKIEPCELPVGFRRQDYINMSSWDGAPRSNELDPLIDALEQRIGRPANLDLKGVRQYEATWRRFGAPKLAAFALGKPLAVVESDRRLQQATTATNPVVTPPVAPASLDYQHELIALAAREWPAVRDSDDPQRLERFERGFPGTFYAEEARAQRQKIEAGARRRRDAEAKRQPEEREFRAARQHDAEAKRQTEEREFRAAGGIPVLVGDRDQNQTKWLLPGAGEVFCDLDGGPEMVVVPAGSFMMGSPKTEQGLSSEGPPHKVMIAKPFAVGRHAVTRGQFAAFVKATEAEGADSEVLWRNPGFPQDDSHPVTRVNWDDAKAYISWLAEATGKPYRFLTEAEWEYAARAGTTTPFWWGTSITPAQANYDGRLAFKGGSIGKYRKGTVPVGEFAANPWGLYNVHGNVGEWCEDVWHHNYNRAAPTDGSAWLQGGDRSSRVVRGGDWDCDPRDLRSTRRVWHNAEDRSIVLGFRLARTLTS